MNERSLEHTGNRAIGRIVVALDASTSSLAALRAAIGLAELLNIEIEGLFIEDINLLYLCGFPFSKEIGSYTAKVRSIENVGIERQLRAQAHHIQKLMEQLAFQHSVRWTFNVRRGSVVKELLNAAQNAEILSIGRSGQARQSTLGSTARALVQSSQRPLLLLDEGTEMVYPLIAIYTGSETSQRVLRWITSLATASHQTVRVLLVIRPDIQRTLPELEAEAHSILDGIAAEFLPVRYGNVLMTLRAHNGGTLVLPSEYAELVTEHTGPTIIVP